MMFSFLLIQWKLGRIDETRLQTAVTKGYITEAEMEQIMAE
jgi:hypothetical protein